MLRLATLRKEKGISQEEMARHLNIRVESLSRIENGHFNAERQPWRRVRALEQILGVTAEDIFSTEVSR